MAAKSNKRTIHYQEGEGEHNLLFENHQAESRKTKGCNLTEPLQPHSECCVCVYTCVCECV